MFNPIRIKYITENIKKYYNIKNERPDFLTELIYWILAVVEVLYEPMTRLGAKVTGIDASEKNVNVAKLHSEESGLSIKYLNLSPEN